MFSWLFQSWGGKESGFGLAACCSDVAVNSFPHSASSLHFDFYAEKQQASVKQAKVKRAGHFSTGKPEMFCTLLDQCGSATVFFSFVFLGV